MLLILSFNTGLEIVATATRGQKERKSYRLKKIKVLLTVDDMTAYTENPTIDKRTSKTNE